MKLGHIHYVPLGLLSLFVSNLHQHVVLPYNAVEQD